jgi:hypothetical protein
MAVVESRPWRYFDHEVIGGLTRYLVTAAVDPVPGADPE